MTIHRISRNWTGCDINIRLEMFWQIKLWPKCWNREQYQRVLPGGKQNQRREGNLFIDHPVWTSLVLVWALSRQMTCGLSWEACMSNSSVQRWFAPVAFGVCCIWRNLCFFCDQPAGFEIVAESLGFMGCDGLGSCWIFESKTNNELQCVQQWLDMAEK